ncbi:XPG domain containing-domain-containing protein [Annulohypoxylon moriforme]|nr:XPG domain containing-domain-containing protein [Annulohypoxylon moriforme]
MGIRGLTTAIQRYGILSPLSGDTVVIDGPALVHRISESCMNNRPSSSGFACLPSYNLLSRMVIGWLNDLQSHNINVRKIYFDGYLPPSKWDVRKERLVRQSLVMKKLIHSDPIGLATTPANAFDHLKVGIHMTDEGAREHNKTPKPPFLVPAVLEALKNDEHWGPLVVVVPGEADMFCAQDIRENGGTVLTADSDLLIQDLGLEGNVVFFWNILSGHPPFTDAGIKALKMSFHDINRQLRIETLGGLSRVAFEKQRNKKAGDMDFNTALHNARHGGEDVLNSPEYKGFMKELELKVYIPSHHPVLSLLSGLDPRISEIVIQTLLLEETEPSTIVEKKELRGPETLSIFLPILLENRNNVSAWGQSTNIRELAYSFLQGLAHQRSEWVIEYRTLDSSATYSGRRIRIPDLDKAVAESTRLVVLLEKLTESFSSTDMQWLAFAVYWDIRRFVSEKQRLLSTTCVKEATRQPKGPENYSWDIIHFTAQFQAHFYSLRILKQILDVVVAMDQDLPAPAQQLHNRLASLPLIAEWPTVERMHGLLLEFDKLGGLAITTAITGIPTQLMVQLRGEEKKKRRKDERERQSLKKKIDIKKFRSANLFAILSEEKTD